MKKNGILLFLSSILMLAKMASADTLYIDPTFTGDIQTGTIKHPYNSWSDFTIIDGNTYLQKRSTSYSSATYIYINNGKNITLGAYGIGSRPKFLYKGNNIAIRIDNSSFCLVENLEVEGTPNAFALIGVYGSTSNLTSNISIKNCRIHNAHGPDNGGFGIHGFHNNKLSILHTEIFDLALDGIYLANEPNIEIGYCKVYDINKRFFVNPNQSYSSGDGIQLDGNYDGFHIHHTTIDRTNGAGNKFNLILASKVGTSDNAQGIIEHCTFLTGANVSSALHIEMGNGIITRNNIFKGNTQGIRLGGAYTSNNLIHNNLFYNCTSGIGIGYTYPSEGPCTNTNIYNNVFYHVSKYHIWVDKSFVNLANNIHIRTTDSGIALYNYGGGTWNISNNCYSSLSVAGAIGPGINPIIGNPLFVNAPEYDFHLQSNSPCIDAGKNLGLAEDFDNTAVPKGNSTDIGAFEYFDNSHLIMIEKLVKNTFCAGTEIEITFSVNENFNGENNFIAQLSDEWGEFHEPINFGSIKSQSANTIKAVIPRNINEGAGYRVRIIGTDPFAIGKKNENDIIIQALQKPLVDIGLISGSNPSCKGTSLTLKAIPLNGGSAPEFNWKINEIEFNFNKDEFISTTLNNGDVIVCEMRSNETCITDSISFSNEYKVEIWENNFTPVIDLINGDTLLSNVEFGNQWYKSNELIFGATANFLKVDGPGNYYTVHTDVNGCKSVVSNIIDVIVSGIDKQNSTDLKIYPNPSSSYIYVETGILSQSVFRYEIIDISSKKIRSGTLDSNIVKVDIGDIPEGTYLFTISNISNRIISKVFVKDK